MIAYDWMPRVARAKVNLALRIFPREGDFHPVETILCRITLADKLRVRLRPEPGVALRLSGSELAPEGPENLAARAAGLFLDTVGVTAGVEIELAKRIPAGSGLGGGSSDAATVLEALNAGTGEPLGGPELLDLASKLGADVPFFAADSPLAFGSERGDRLTALRALPTRPILLLIPDVAISTAEAYAQWDEAHPSRSTDKPVKPSASPLEGVADWESLRALAVNDFEPVIFRHHPRLVVLKEKLEHTDSMITLLSGSGSALFAVYDSDERRDAALQRLGALEDARTLSVSGPV